MRKKHTCSTCKVEMEEGFLSDGKKIIGWNKGKPTLWRSIFSKFHLVSCYSCPNCGRMEFYRKIKVKE